MSIVIPNINDALISEEKLTLKESESRYIELLDAVSNAKHANKIREYQDITNLTNLHKFNSDCMELIKYLNKSFFYDFFSCY